MLKLCFLDSYVFALVMLSFVLLTCLFVIYHRYLELVFPIWHKTHFKMKYLYIAIAMSWIFGIGLNAAYVIPTSKVFYICQNYLLSMIRLYIMDKVDLNSVSVEVSMDRSHLDTLKPKKTY